MENRLKFYLSAICFTAAGFIAANGLDGWGWFLVVGVLLV